MTDSKQPRIVCLCGSTRFYEAFVRAAYEETMAGRIVLSVAFAVGPSGAHSETFGCTPEQKMQLDELHLRRIDIAHEILVLNVDGYVGPSTAREMAYAMGTGKLVRFLEPQAGETYLQTHSHKLGQMVGQFAADAAGMTQSPSEPTGPYPCKWCVDSHFTNECPLRPYRPAMP